MPTRQGALRIDCHDWATFATAHYRGLAAKCRERGSNMRNAQARAYMLEAATGADWWLAAITAPVAELLADDHVQQR
jgi:hypothetical protein